MQTSRPPLLRTNLDTNLLKLVAILSMTLDRADGLPPLLLLYDGGDALYP